MSEAFELELRIVRDKRVFGADPRKSMETLSETRGQNMLCELVGSKLGLRKVDHKRHVLHRKACLFEFVAQCPEVSHTWSWHSNCKVFLGGSHVEKLAHNLYRFVGGSRMVKAKILFKIV